MKIGLLAYHSAINFGATLQLLSTYYYCKNNGHTPIVINWVPEDLEAFYKKRATNEQIVFCKLLRESIWKESNLCRTSEDVAREIKINNIDAVIIGSDAVAQHHPFLERVIFPTKRIFNVRKYTSDRMFPNPFWGEFNKYLEHPVPVAVMSASNQDSAFHLIPFNTKIQMKKAIMAYCYISVRDSWTQEMIKSVTAGNRIPLITPDPVFAFNYNASDAIPSRNEIIARYNLPEKYILMTFESYGKPDDAWFNEFECIAKTAGYTCVSVPFSDRKSMDSLRNRIDLPLSPIDWYALIKYSSGYVGHNMHPIVVSLHNAVPFYSFDNYGTKKFRNKIATDKTSKIKHILERASFMTNRISCISSDFKTPSAQEVFGTLINMDVVKERIFADSYYQEYKQMMTDIFKSIV